MDDGFWVLGLVSGWLAVTLPLAVLYHLRRRVAPMLPLRGRWLARFLWASVSLSFVLVVSLVAMQPH